MQQQESHLSRFVLCMVLLVLTQEVCSGPVQSPEHTPKRLARSSPLWRIMNSKPFGAYCQNNYECSTGLCRAGYCSTNQRSPSEVVNY
ncbi:liver-expressed antimicrobial peptide 2 isoform X1 [Dunckerocampus dactyliophorus]|uniref:liver-expressed antimicrobial peptide 2 isoform X1 n=1 Tax=Dunckerocampus dactyliophorus TaxID=161453 RepID=UPI002406E00D|nr:liver-expressed antimicrobial peptide 2 isoform X1 [Dunckerocampus dactyliophorus]